MQKDSKKHETPTAANNVLAVRCIRSHEDGLTKGKVYDAHKHGEWGYDVFPDDNGYLSGWDKRYFEVVEQLPLTYGACRRADLELQMFN